MVGFLTTPIPPMKRGRGRPPGSKNKPKFGLVNGLISADDIDMTLPDGNTEESESDIDTRITKTFKVLDTFIRGAIQGDITSLIVSGAGGCGKTFTVDALTVAAENAGLIRRTEHGGSVSAVGLYKLFYHNRFKKNLLITDDCDTLYFDQDALNVMKRALDSKPTRTVSWSKESWALLTGDEPVPQSFDYEGGAIFITNLDLQGLLERGTKFAPHYSALLSRSIYVDLGIHTKREILVRIKQVINTTNFLKDNALTKQQGNDMITWLAENIHKVRTLSIRTCLQIGAMIRTNSDWRDLAEVTLFRRS